MKRNWTIIAFTFLLTVALWAQTATPAPQANQTDAGCACCNMGDKAAAHHDMQGMKGGHAAMSCCAGKEGMACARKGKDAKAGCCAGMKDDAKKDGTSAKAGTCCGKECCKDGKCTMAKSGKCCEKCPNCKAGETAAGK